MEGLQDPQLMLRNAVVLVWMTHQGHVYLRAPILQAAGRDQTTTAIVASPAQHRDALARDRAAQLATCLPGQRPASARPAFSIICSRLMP